eukprot:sb/3471074/
MLARSVMGAAACSGTKAVTSAGTGGRKPIVVISGPSGCGKSTLLNKLFKQHPDRFGFSVSHTTRQPRPGETDGVHYHFVERAKMDSLIAAGEFLEHANFGSNTYGTSRSAVESVCGIGQICILDIELQGVLQVKELTKDLIPLFVYIQPPSYEILEQRLTNRNTETSESLEKRLKQAKVRLLFSNLRGSLS